MNSGSGLRTWIPAGIAVSIISLLFSIGCARPEDDSPSASTPAPESTQTASEPESSELVTETVQDQTGSAMLTEFVVRPASVTLNVGDTQTLKGVGRDTNQVERDDLVITWATENPSVASVSPDGVVSAIAPGKSLITAFVSGKSASVEVQVLSEKLVSVRIRTASTTIAAGETENLELIGIDEKKRERGPLSGEWSSSQPSVVTVTQEGIVSAVKPGKAVITAKSQEKSAKINLTVTPPSLATLTLEPPTATLEHGDSLKLSYSAVDVRNTTRKDLSLKWSSSDSSVASVSASGKIEAVGPGKAKISASSEGKSAVMEVTVKPVELVKLTLTPESGTIAPGEGKQFQIIGIDPKKREVKNPQVSWNVKNSAIASVNATGIVTGIGEGTTQITASSGKVSSNPISVTVKKREVAEGVPTPRDQLRAKYKNINPEDLIYLSGLTGDLAGTGDPTGFAGDAERAGLSPHPQALEISQLPKDKYGLIDWAAAIKSGQVKPRESIDAKEKPALPPLDLDIVIKAKSDFQPDVVFPHLIHTMWLDCGNCHDTIFKKKAGGHPEMTMPKITSGEYCGRCHNRVAFPLSDCLRCHTKPKDGSPAAP